MNLIPIDVLSENLHQIMAEIGSGIVNKTGQDTGVRMWLPYERSSKDELEILKANWINEYTGELLNGVDMPWSVCDNSIRKLSKNQPAGNEHYCLIYRFDQKRFGLRSSCVNGLYDDPCTNGLLKNRFTVCTLDVPEENMITGTLVTVFRKISFLCLFI